MIHFRFRLFVLMLAFFVIGKISPSDAKPKSLRIGTLLDGPSEGYEQLLDQIRKEVVHLLEGEAEVSFPKQGTLVMDWTQPKVASGLTRLLEDPGVDLVVTIGALASEEACSRSSLAKPVVASLVVDAEFQKLPFSNGVSGRKNLSYLAAPWELERDLEVFREVVPIKKLAIVMHDAWLERLYKVRTRAQIKAYIQKQIKEFVLVPASDSAEKALGAIPKDVDAVYMMPLAQMSQKELDKFIMGLIKRKLPSFSMVGRSHVERGVLLGLRPADDMLRMARQVALHVQRILDGEDAGSLPVAFSSGSHLVLNVKTSRTIGTSPPYQLILEAERLHDSAGGSARRLDLHKVIEEATDANLEIALAHQDVVIGSHERQKATANLLPTLNLETMGLMIDSDRAKAGMGQAPEYTWTASLILQEVLAEGAFANRSIQGYLQNARKLKEQEVRLDIIEAAVLAYLNVLRASVQERIQKNNLRLSRSNLELAYKRLAIGSSRMSEVYRWESEIARQRQAVINAHLAHSLAELELNRLLLRPLEEEFSLEEIGLDQMVLMGKHKNLHELLNHPFAMKVFRNYLVQQAYQTSPELSQLEESLMAQKRLIQSIHRSFWLPTLGLQAQADQRLAKAGHGSEGLPPEMAPLAVKQDDVQWSVGLFLSWPLFEGTLRWAELEQSQAQLAKIKMQRDRIKQLLDQRVRAALQNTRASGTNIQLSEKAAQAADKNLALVTDAYGQGAVSVIDLLDAQNASLVANLAKSHAEFAFMMDMVKAQRAAGRYFVLMNDQTKDDWIEHFEKHLKEHENGSHSFPNGH